MMSTIPSIQILLLSSSKEELAKRYIELCLENLSKSNDLEKALKKLQDKDEENTKLKERIAELEKRPKKPKFNDSKKSNNAESRGKVCKDAKKKRGKTSKTKPKSELAIDKEEILKVDNLPEGAVFNGYKKYFVQDIKITKFNTVYKRAVYLLPDGTTLIAELPDSVKGSHYGPELRSFILNEYYAKRVTQPLIHDYLQDIGIFISKAQINNIINSKISEFEQEYNDILLNGLLHSYYLQVDDTGSKHNGDNGYCTVIGNEAFAWYKSTDSKSRANFLDVLTTPCGVSKYIFNSSAEKYLATYDIKLSVLKDHSFATRDDLTFFLDFYGIKGVQKLKRLEEAGLIGALDTIRSVEDIFIMSDNAKQFSLFNHLQCWVHFERNIKKFMPTNKRFLKEVNTALDLIWDIYGNIRDYKVSVNAEKKKDAESKFEKLKSLPVTYEPLKDQIEFMTSNSSEFLMALENPILPLHNNLCENDVRQYVMKRNISGETKSEAGKNSRDIFLSLKTTCRKSGINFLDYLKSRLGKTAEYPSISNIVINAIKAHNLQAKPLTC